MIADFQQLLQMLGPQSAGAGQSLGGQGTGLLSNVSPPAPLSGLNFADSGMSGTQGGGQGLSGGPGQGGILAGQSAGPGLDIYQMLAQMNQGDQGGPNTGSLLSPIGGSDFEGITPQNFGQQEVPGQRGAGPQQGTFAGQTGGDLDSMALIQQALGLLQRSGFSNYFGTPDLGTRGDVGGSSLGEIVRESESGGFGGQTNPVDGQGGVNEEGAGGGFSGPTGQQVGGGLQGLQGLLGLAQGIQGGDIAQGVGGALGAGGGLSKLLGESGFGSAFGGLGGLEGLIQGIRGGNPEEAVKGAAGLYGGLSGLDLAPSIGSLAGSAAEGLGATSALEGLTEMLAGFGGSAALGAAGGMMLPVIMAMFNPNSLSLPFSGNRAEAAIRDTKNVRRDFGTAEGQVLGGERAYDHLAGGAPVNPNDLQALWTANEAMGGPALSQYFGTSGGAQGGLIPAMPSGQLDALRRQSDQATNKSYWGLLAGLDQAARSGQSYPELSLMTVDGLTALQKAARMGDVTDPALLAQLTGRPGAPLADNPNVSDYGVLGQAPDGFLQSWKPGNYLSAIQQVLAPYNQHLDQSAWGQLTNPFMGNYGTPDTATQGNMDNVFASWLARTNEPWRNPPPIEDPAQFMYMNGRGY